MADIHDSEQRHARLLALGRIADQAALVESVVRSFVGALIGGPRALVVVGGQSMTWLVETALAIIKNNDEVRAPSLGDPANVEAFVRSLKRASELYRLRNDALHGVWAEEGFQFLSKYRQPHPIYNPSNIESLNKLADDLGTAAASVIHWGTRVDGLVTGFLADDEEDGE